MVGKKPFVAALLFVVALGYVAYPYVTLWRLGAAIRSGDAPTLQAMVDWPAVREGIKEDICDFVIDQPAEARNGGQLPPFGSGFVRGIAAHSVDSSVTPEALASAAHQPIDAASMPRSAMQVSWAFFSSPTQFMIDLHARGQATPIRLQLDLRNGSWQVTRVWLPPELLDQANART